MLFLCHPCLHVYRLRAAGPRLAAAQHGVAKQASRGLWPGRPCTAGLQPEQPQRKPGAGQLHAQHHMRQLGPVCRVGQRAGAAGISLYSAPAPTRSLGPLFFPTNSLWEWMSGGHYRSECPVYPSGIFISIFLFAIIIHYLLFAVQPWGVYVVHPTIVFPVNLFNQHKLKLYNVDKRMPRMLYLQCTSCIVGAFISF